jgi:hypothetical protein
MTLEHKNVESAGINRIIFNPEYTNQVFDENEEIKGYKDLRIDIYTLSGSLKSYVEISYKEKSKDADEL